MNYLAAFSLAAVLSAGLTPLARRLAERIGAIDQPNEARKIHLKPIARLGGVAIFGAFVITSLVFIPISRQFVALLLGLTLLFAVGVVDDIRGVSPWVKLFWQIVAACVVLAGGIGVTSITSPLGGVIALDWGRFPVDFWYVHFNITPIGNLLSIIWMVGLVNAINFLDGLDGLACGVSAIAALIMFVLAVGLKVGQVEVALLAIILVGTAIGFLPFNFYPARIFMGDSGAYVFGLILALLAIYSGGKLATATLVLGFTIFDALFTAARRLLRRSSPFRADRQHLHHLLLEIGWSQRQAVLLLYVLAIGFGVSALFLGSFTKLIALGVMLMTLAGVITWLWWRWRKLATKT